MTASCDGRRAAITCISGKAFCAMTRRRQPCLGALSSRRLHRPRHRASGRGFRSPRAAAARARRNPLDRGAAADGRRPEPRRRSSRTTKRCARCARSSRDRRSASPARWASAASCSRRASSAERVDDGAADRVDEPAWPRGRDDAVRREPWLRGGRRAHRAAEGSGADPDGVPRAARTRRRRWRRRLEDEDASAEGRRARASKRSAVRCRRESCRRRCGRKPKPPEPPKPLEAKQLPR